MTTYKEIFGKYVKNYSSDPTSDIEGQIWYNSTSGTFKSEINVADSWSSGGNLNVARDVFAGAGTQTATAVFGGRGLAGDPVTAIATENYNGSTWTTSGNMSTQRRYCAGCGDSQTAALAVSGQNQISPVTASEEYGGSSWTSGGSYPFAFGFLMVTGTQTAAISAGGPYPSVPQSQSAFEYDGSSWTGTGNLNTRRSSGNGIGIQTAALFVGGYGGGFVSAVESYDGTSFTTDTSTPTPQGGGGSGGTQTSAIVFANDPAPYVAITFNGTSWATSVAQLNTGRGNVAKTITGAPATGVIAVGGNTGPAIVASTEEYTVGGLATKTITTS
jgi:hypothetical protein